MKLRLPLKGADVGDPETWTDVHICDSKDAAHVREPRFATKLAYWVTGPVEYCDPCCAWMLQIADTLGTHIHVEEIPLPAAPGMRRAMEVK